VIVDHILCDILGPFDLCVALYLLSQFSFSAATQINDHSFRLCNQLHLLVCLSVCLTICTHSYTCSCISILMTFYPVIRGPKTKIEFPGGGGENMVFSVAPIMHFQWEGSEVHFSGHEGCNVLYGDLFLFSNLLFRQDSSALLA